jgi:quercetin dioxygenase-like cupin family protein
MMQKSNISQVVPDQSMLHYFEGRVELKKMVTEVLTKELETFLVTFFDGARTKLHYHETDQVLIAAGGKGIIVIQTGIKMDSDTSATLKMDEVHYLDEGDFVCVPAGKWHWHGATKGKSFAHYQIKKPGKTVWVE